MIISEMLHFVYVCCMENQAKNYKIKSIKVTDIAIK